MKDNKKKRTVYFDPGSGHSVPVEDYRTVEYWRKRKLRERLIARIKMILVVSIFVIALLWEFVIKPWLY